MLSRAPKSAEIVCMRLHEQVLPSPHRRPLLWAGRPLAQLSNRIVPEPYISPS